MKYIALIITLALSNSALAQENKQSPDIGSMPKESQTDSYLILKGQIGNFRIGSTPDAFYSEFEYQQTELIDLYIEAVYSPAIQVNDIMGIRLIAEIDCNTIFRVRIYDKLYHTKKGISIGSSLKELKSYYGDVEILMGEGSIYAYIAELEMSFELDITQVINSNIDLSKEIKLEGLPEDIEISSILVL